MQSVIQSFVHDRLRTVLKSFLDELVEGLDGEMSYIGGGIGFDNLRVRSDRLQALNRLHSVSLEIADIRLGSISIKATGASSFAITASEVVMDVAMLPLKALLQAYDGGDKEAEGFAHRAQDLRNPLHWESMLNGAQHVEAVPARYCARHSRIYLRKRVGVKMVQCRSCRSMVQTNYDTCMLCPTCSGERKLCLLCADRRVVPDMEAEAHMEAVRERRSRPPQRPPNWEKLPLMLDQGLHLDDRKLMRMRKGLHKIKTSELPDLYDPQGATPVPVPDPSRSGKPSRSGEPSKPTRTDHDAAVPSSLSRASTAVPSSTSRDTAPSAVSRDSEASERTAPAPGWHRRMSLSEVDWEPGGHEGVDFLPCPEPEGAPTRRQLLEDKYADKSKWYWDPDYVPLPDVVEGEEQDGRQGSVNSRRSWTSGQRSKSEEPTSATGRHGGWLPTAASRAIAAVNPWSRGRAETPAPVAFKPHSGYLGGEDSIAVKTMTPAEAKQHCQNLPHCVGFSYTGTSDQTTSTKIWFKDKWAFSEATGWTSFKKVPARPSSSQAHVAGPRLSADSRRAVQV